MFAGRNSSAYGSPLLISSTATISVPQSATGLLAYIVSGGGSGAAAFSTGSQTTASGGGGGCGVFIEIDLVGYRKLGSAVSPTTQLFVTNTIGAGGIAVTGNTAGNPGGSTTFALIGGVSIVATGGGAGATGLGTQAGGAAGTFAAASTFYEANYVSVQKLAIPSAAGPDTGGAGGTASTVTSGSETASAGGSGPAILFPWWIRSIGISALGTGGSGAVVVSGQKAAGGGGGGVGGNGGGGAVSGSTSVTGGTGTGFGSGGGGAAGVGAATSGAGTGGCAVIVFSFEA